MNFWKWFGIIVLVTVILLFVFFRFTPQGQEIWNQYRKSGKTDEITDEQRKEVEDTCRAMISSWETDAEQYRRYKDSDTAEYKELAEQSRINANITATTYNEYLLLNGYVFGDKLPDGVYAVIDVIE